MCRIKTIYLVSSVILTGCTGFRNRIELQNNTKETIRDINLSVCDSSWSIDSLASGHTVSFEVSYQFDDSFRLEIPTGGTHQCGYVTNGMTGDLATIEITADSILCSQRSMDY